MVSIFATTSAASAAAFSAVFARFASALSSALRAFMAARSRAENPDPLLSDMVMPFVRSVTVTISSATRRALLDS
ncbi:hypothetical protein GCM10010455_20100 [Microbacterium esteraromaticum]